MRLFLLSCLVFVLGVCEGQKDNVGSGRALSFDGIDDLVDLGDTYHDVNLPFSISAWLYIDPSVTYPVPIFVTNDNNPIYRGFWFFISPGRIWCEFGDGTGGANPFFRQGKEALLPASVTGRWIHVAAVMNTPADIRLYVNGINVGGSKSGSSSLPMASSFPGDHPKIGYFLSNGVTYRYKGFMDEIRLYNIALTETQVRDGMCKPVLPSQPGLIGYWNFNELGGNTIEDVSPRAAHGTMFGNPTRVFSGAPLGDVSIHDYRATWTNVTFDMTVGTTSFRVGDVRNSPEGIQLYRVNSPPTQSNGLDPLLPNSPYFGVFTCALDVNNQFTVFALDGVEILCRADFRGDNSIDTWSMSVLPAGAQPDRGEYLLRPDKYTPFDLGKDKVSCSGNPVNLSTGLQSSAATFLWSTGATSPSITATKPDRYWVRVESVCGIHSDTVHVVESAPPSPFSFGSDQILCEFKPLVLVPYADTVGLSFLWQDGTATSSYAVKDFGTYSVTVTNECGVASSSVTYSSLVSELTDPVNVITPNGDSFNEFFVVKTDYPDPIVVKVLNRWGQEVFSSTNYKNNWNGSELAAGVYYYTIYGQCLKEARGWLTIMR